MPFYTMVLTEIFNKTKPFFNVRLICIPIQITRTVNVEKYI